MGQTIKKSISALNNKVWLTSLCANISLMLGILTQHSQLAALPIFILPLIQINRKATIASCLFFLFGCLTTKSFLKPEIVPADKPGTFKGMVLDSTENSLRKFPFSYKLDGEVNKQQGRFLLYTKEDLCLSPGDEAIILSLRLSNLNSEDFKRYLDKEGITGTMFAKKPKVKSNKSRRLGFAELFRQLKLNTLKNIQDRLSPEAFSLFSSIFMGNRSECAEEYEEQKSQFKYWGLSHLLARSGLHLVIFIISLTALLSFAHLNFYTKQATRAALVLMYYVLSWPSTSFNRAFLFFIFWEACCINKLQKSYLNLLNAVCITTLLTNPMLLFFAEFQLSFFLTYALAFLIESNHRFQLNS